MRTLIFILTLVCFQRCGFVSKKVYGAKKPRIETEVSITGWLKNNGLPSGEVVTVDTIGFYNFFPSLAQAPLLFEKNGKFRAAGFSNGKYCPQNVDIYLSRVNRLDQMNALDSFIIRESYTIPPDQARNLGSFSKNKFDELKKITAVSRDTIKMNLLDINKMFYFLNGSKTEPINTDGFDFVLILPFAKFYGNKLQIADLKKYYYSAINNPRAKFKIVFLNLDKQSWWGKEVNERIHISM